MQLRCLEDLSCPPLVNPSPRSLPLEEVAAARALIVRTLEEEDEGGWAKAQVSDGGSEEGTSGTSAAPSDADLALWTSIAVFVRHENARSGLSTTDAGLAKAALTWALTCLGRRHLALQASAPVEAAPGPSLLNSVSERVLLPRAAAAAGRPGITQQRPRSGPGPRQCYQWGKEVARDVWQPPHPFLQGWWTEALRRPHHWEDPPSLPSPTSTPPIHATMASARAGAGRRTTPAERNAINGALLALQAAGLGMGFEGLDAWGAPVGPREAHGDVDGSDDEDDGLWGGPGGLAWGNERED